ncbi:hypothetical protein ABZP36_026302 [Zizania latifolia]
MRAELGETRGECGCGIRVVIRAIRRGTNGAEASFDFDCVEMSRIICEALSGTSQISIRRCGGADCSLRSA